ncbi:MAG: hypothetical protein J3Q66DRAFT_286855, partial [Benniella sp.]
WVNNPTLTEFCFSMIGRADIEGSKSNVAMNAWLPQACPSQLQHGKTCSHQPPFHRRCVQLLVVSICHDRLPVHYDYLSLPLCP